MDALVRSAENVLRRHAAPALRLSELLGHVRSETGLRTLDAGRLRGVLETRPDRFRLLDPWRGPWRFVRRGSTTGRGVDPWVVVVGDPGDEGGAREGRPRPDRRLSASVRWLALTLDATSGRTVSRWHGIAVASDAARTALARKAA
jgi:hypothetical protein